LAQAAGQFPRLMVERVSTVMAVNISGNPAKSLVTPAVTG
jgi:hypothetical protein